MYDAERDLLEIAKILVISLYNYRQLDWTCTCHWNEWFVLFLHLFELLFTTVVYFTVDDYSHARMYVTLHVASFNKALLSYLSTM